MENITNYCDEIYEILCSLDKNTNTKDCDRFIWHDQRRIIEWSELGVSCIRNAEDDEMTIEEVEEEERMISKIVDFLQEDCDLCSEYCLRSGL